MQGYTNELYHHGVRGQKWGVRRYQNYDGTKIRSRQTEGTSQLKYHSKAADSAKNFAITFGKYAVSAVIPGAGLLMTAKSIADYTTYNFDGKDYAKKEGSAEKLSDLKRKSDKSSISDDARKVNPRIGHQAGTVNNCMNCTAAMEMRRRGYDVIARKSGQGTNGNSFETWFPGSKCEFLSVKRGAKESKKDYVIRGYSTLCKQLESYGKGARGAVGVRFDKLNAGHSMFWEVTDHGIEFYDGQLGSGKTDKTFSFADPEQYSYTRLDSCSVDASVTTRIRSAPTK